MMKRSGVLCSLLFLFALGGCATSITYPVTPNFNISKPLEDQLLVIEGMRKDYSTKSDQLAASNDSSALSNIGWGVALISAAAYKAPKDAITGLALGAGANTVTNSTFNVNGQLGLYQAATSALICMRNVGENLVELGVIAKVGTHSFRLNSFSRLTTSDEPCFPVEPAAPAKKGAHRSSEEEKKVNARLAASCLSVMANVRKAARVLDEQNDRASAINPGRQMAYQLQILDKTLKDKLRGLLVVKDPGAIKDDMTKLVAAATAEKKATDGKAIVGSGVVALQGMSILDNDEDLSAENARADYDAALIGFDSALTSCRSGVGM